MTDEAPRQPSRLTRWIVIAVVAVVVLVVLFTVVFPWLERNLSNPTMGVVTVTAAAVTPVVTTRG